MVMVSLPNVADRCSKAQSQTQVGTQLPWLAGDAGHVGPAAA